MSNISVTEQTLVAEIEKKLDHEEDVAETAFDSWFDSFVNSTPKKDEETNDETENKTETKKDNAEMKEDKDQIINEEEDDENFDEEEDDLIEEEEDNTEEEVKNEPIKEIKTKSEEKPNEETKSEPTPKPQQSEQKDEQTPEQSEQKNESTTEPQEIETVEEIKPEPTPEPTPEPKDEEIETVEPEPIKEEIKHETVNEEIETVEPEPVNESKLEPQQSESINETVNEEIETPEPIDEPHKKHRVKKYIKKDSSTVDSSPSITSSPSSVNNPSPQSKLFEHAMVEVSDKAPTHEPTQKEVAENIAKSKTNLINDINEQVQQMEKDGNARHIDASAYTVGSELANVFYQYILGKLFVPRNRVMTLDINDYINNTTIFKYNSFDAPNTAMQHSIPEKVIFMSKLNELFDYQFVKPQSGEFHFNDLDKQVTKFLFNYKDYGTTKLEYGIIKSLLGKLIISLNTSCELALRDNTRARINTEFKQAIIGDIECMKFIQGSEGKLYTSWKTFLNTLLSVGSDNLIYVHDNYTALNAKLKLAYENDFLTENLLANMLKCYLPSVAINYFYVIKSIYIISRLLSIYIQNKLFIDKSTGKKKDMDVLVNEIYTIAVAGVIMYENKSFIFKQIPRSLPKYEKEITEQTKMYILNHLITGGQYYILKMFEESLPIVASLL